MTPVGAVSAPVWANPVAPAGQEQTLACWDGALLAAGVIALDPRGIGGVRLRARAGAVRDRWLQELSLCLGPSRPIRRISASIAEDRLVGGLDLGQTLTLGRPVVEPGVLAGADGGVLVLGMAERVSPASAAIIAAALDHGEVAVERDGLSARHPARFALIALDEGIDDEVVPASLADRLGLAVDLNAIGWREAAAGFSTDTIVAGRALLPSVTIGAAMVEALSVLALAYGGPSMRRPLHLLRTARACAALRGVNAVESEDAENALHLVLGLEVLPAPADAGHPDQAPLDAPSPLAKNPQPAPDDPVATAVNDNTAGDERSAGDLAEILVAAMAGHLPVDLLDRLARLAFPSVRTGLGGGAGADRATGRRGPVVGIAAKPPVPGARLDLLATLRQAAPWQRLRSAATRAPLPDGAPRRLHLRLADFRYPRRREQAGTTAIFAVDASGSAAVERLAETKGAIELLLAGCYVRRDSVGLIAFRGSAAASLLEPTRSLVRAKRCLAALPGGGGTPLAGGILAALDMVRAARRKGHSAIAVFLTDGRGNIALDGSTGRDRVEADTQRAALLFKGSGLRAIVIDTARRGHRQAEALARGLGAEYLLLPQGGARAVARAVGARMDG